MHKRGAGGGKGLAVDTRRTSADVQKQNSTNPEDRAARAAVANDAPRAGQEYLDTLATNSQMKLP